MHTHTQIHTHTPLIESLSDGPMLSLTCTVPRWAMSRDVSFPIPVLAPVMSTVLPSSRTEHRHTPPAIHFLNRIKPWGRGSTNNEVVKRLIFFHSISVIVVTVIDWSEHGVMFLFNIGRLKCLSGLVYYIHVHGHMLG